MAIFMAETETKWCFEATELKTKNQAGWIRFLFC